MRRRSWIIAIGTATAAQACVGGDPDTAATPPDASTSSDDAAATGDGGLDATDASVTGDSGSDAIADAAGDDAASCGAVPVANGATFECAATPCATGATEVCCRRGGNFGCGSGTGGCDDTVVDIQCDGPSDCGSLACCLAGTLTGTCPASAGTQVKLACNALVNCAGADRYVTCNDACSGGKTCTPTMLPTGKLVGVCL